MGQVWSNNSDELANCCCDYKLVLLASKTLEKILEEDFEASGRGLHEKITTAQGLDEPTIKKLRLIATVRNKFVHELDEGNEELRQKDVFKTVFHEARESLVILSKERQNEEASRCSVM
mmetsp:Transcript_6280/g.11167  ORF Transcript_6280/g.11167 Transcript_6280/m.11167 type:complete len:119 (+) Transcript_6280:152-508(+)|eukprot:CAMPEP_0184528298 /NCGR_PEP_ID=MMETSP0198_2-20121128/11715_1 /TAXON_ID=1112570 /ORGANISM="Thraustochytrium sp., Strain LLF1b" /LENGTH=118 /DNA_ID=CAMNT_0026920131 /DNA_START=74 /DNA_END=430 /DNA_ORIENTATION=+